VGWSSTVPAAIGALVTAFRTAPGLEGVPVRDGPAVENQAAREVIAVGYAGDDDDLAVESETSPEGLGREPDRERYSIRCAAAVLRGATDVAAARSRAYELVAAAGEAIARDRTLGGAVMRAGVSTTSLQQSQTDRGVQVMVTFSVDCDAFTRR